MTQSIKLVGLDCGSTTTSAVIAKAQLVRGALGRVEITSLEPVFRSETVFTPFDDDRIDAARMEQYVDDWLKTVSLSSADIFGGGALITGLAAQSTNAAAVSRLIEARLSDSLVVTADDPRLESWLAFMGNCHALSKAQPRTPILNLDIGGGTTNLALGLDGQVVTTGCLFVGARHFQFVPGTYQLVHLSPYAAALLAHLKINRHIGDSLTPAELDAILDFYLMLIEATVLGQDEKLASEIAQRHIQVPLNVSELIGQKFAITLSGGVGQLVYAQRAAGSPGPITQFGDLGGELATRVSQSSTIASRLDAVVPEGLGRATVYGLLKHNTELSGTTLYLPKPERLPLKNIPIVGTLGLDATDDELASMVDLAGRGAPGGCIEIGLEKQDLAAVRQLGNRLANCLQARPLPCDRVLILLVPENLGKVLGNYVSRWGTLEIDLIAIDEVPSRDARFLHLGRMQQGIVPVWLYGMQ